MSSTKSLVLSGITGVSMVAGSLSFAHFLILGGPNAPNSTFLRAVGNVGLILGFGAQHTILAQPSVKKELSLKLGLSDMEYKKFYLAVSAISLGLIPLFWKSLPEKPVWKLKIPSWLVEGCPKAFGFEKELLARCVIDLGLMVVPFLSIAVNASTLGIFAEEETTSNPEPTKKHVLVSTGSYALVRHPMYLSLLVMLLATTNMSRDRLVATGGIILYLLSFGIPLEEAKLEQIFGKDAYQTYRHKVPASLIPFIPI